MASSELGNTLLRYIFDTKLTALHPTTESSHRCNRGPHTLARISLDTEILGEAVNMAAKKSRAMTGYDMPVSEEILQHVLSLFLWR